MSEILLEAMIFGGDPTKICSDLSFASSFECKFSSKCRAEWSSGKWWWWMVVVRAMQEQEKKKILDKILGKEEKTTLAKDQT